MEEKAAEEELSVLCKSYEDIISRKLYSWRGIPDERISASLHKFLEQEQDMEVRHDTCGQVALYFIMHCGNCRLLMH